jgi:AAA15 family ATPase/GTPase
LFLEETSNQKYEFAEPALGEKNLYCLMNGVKVPFQLVASTGTLNLELQYFWLKEMVNASFVFIDEFDAFLHYEAAERLVKLLNNAEPRFQSILTTHNTYLMQNRLTRPDCCFLMSNNKITNLRSATDKEIREAHNLEKMYINGAFVEP